MKYEKPVVIISDDISEGIFMASGIGACYFTNNSSDGSGKEYRLNLTYNGSSPTDELIFTLNKRGIISFINGTVRLAFGYISYVSQTESTITLKATGMTFEPGYSNGYFGGLHVEGEGDFDIWG